MKAVFLDFDGVVLESTEIKTRAFEELFADHPDHVHEIVALHLRLAGVSRYEKFRMIHEDILGLPFDDEVSAELGERFAAIALEQVLACRFVAGAREFIERRSAEFDLFVASGTPEQELRGIVEARGLAPFFAGVYGSPATKAEIVGRVRSERGLERADCLFVGDAMTDLEGAREAGVAFVGRLAPGEPDPFPPDCGPVVADLAELDSRLDELCAEPLAPPLHRR